MTSERKVGILTFLSLAAVAAQMLIYRKTFINFWIPFSIFFAGGFLLFALLRNKITYYRQNEHSFIVQAFQGTIMFGGITVLTFIGLNYYVPIGKDHKVEMKVIETEYLSSRRGCDSPYAIVHYNGMEKQLVFPCKADLYEGQNIQVSLNRGLFGFLIVGEMTTIVSSEEKEIKPKTGPEGQYRKILDAAESKLANGDTAKAIDYLNRAIQLKPSDYKVKKRLTEILQD